VVLIERAGTFQRVPGPGKGVIILTHCLPGRLAIGEFPRRPLPAEGYDFHPLADDLGKLLTSIGRISTCAAWIADPGTGPGLHGCDAPAGSATLRP
jgi:hypothetical protein